MCLRISNLFSTISLYQKNPYINSFLKPIKFNYAGLENKLNPENVFFSFYFVFKSL